MRAPTGRAIKTLVGAALLLASGCSAQGDDVSPTQRPVIDGETLRNGVSYDYDVASSATELAARAPVTVAGTVESWSDGRAFDEAPDQRVRYAVLEIAVDESAGEVPELGPTDPMASAPPATTAPSSDVPPAAPSPGASDPPPPVSAQDPGFGASADVPRTIFVEFYRGSNEIDGNGDDVVLPEGERTQLSVEDLQEAAPVGARLLFMGGSAPSDEEAARSIGPVTKSWEPPFEGAELLRPELQGLLLEDADGSYVSALVEQADVQGRGWPDEPGDGSSGDEYEQLLDDAL